MIVVKLDVICQWNHRIWCPRNQMMKLFDHLMILIHLDFVDMYTNLVTCIKFIKVIWLWNFTHMFHRSIHTPLGDHQFQELLPPFKMPLVSEDLWKNLLILDWQLFNYIVFAIQIITTMFASCGVVLAHQTIWKMCETRRQLTDRSYPSGNINVAPGSNPSFTFIHTIWSTMLLQSPFLYSYFQEGPS